MHDEVEFLIEQILARKEEADPGQPHRDPNCPDEMLLMAVALDMAPADKQREVEDHAAQCAECRWRLEDYRKYYRDEEVPEPPIKGSLLEIAADRRPIVPKPSPTPAPQPPVPSPSETPIGQGTVLGFTQLAEDPKRWPELLAKLAPWLPFLLRRVSLPEDEAGNLLHWIEQRLPERGDRRFRHALADWLAEFVRARGRGEPGWLPSAMTPNDVDEWAVQIETQGDGPDEPETLRRLKTAVRDRKIIHSDGILGVDYPGANADPIFPEHRSRLFFQAQNRYEEGQLLFELV